MSPKNIKIRNVISKNKVDYIYLIVGKLNGDKTVFQFELELINISLGLSAHHYIMFKFRKVKSCIEIKVMHRNV